MIQENLLEYIEKSIKNNWNISALSDYKGKPYTYSEVGELITGLHLFFNEKGIQKGDKIALISNNSANWAVIFLAVVSYGAIVVPVLADFTPKDIHNIVTHSDAKLLFSSEPVWKTLNIKKMNGLKLAFSVENFTSLTVGDTKNVSKELFVKKFPNGMKPEEIDFQEMKKENIAVISYTSGTTGFSKGVMISHNSLAANVRFAHRHMPLNPGDSILSLLTIAHVFGMVFDFLFPFTLGCHITFLTKIPSLPILTQAYSEVQPRLILLVPLLLEKIYKNKLVPTIKKPLMRTLLKIPGLRQIIFKSINRKISAVFGGQFRELILGGAAFSQDADKFFMQIKFPFTVGYGMTECAPLISYASWNTHKFESCGEAVDTLEVKIDSDDPETIVGEIMVKGDNVMEGYYKNPEATEQVLNKDGWLRTGDLGLIDGNGAIFIKGRNKSMILGSSGKNIYPEEIESLINTRYFILESIVIEKDQKLIALVCPDQDKIKTKGVKQDELNVILEKYRKKINKRLPDHANIAKFELHIEEFEKTPKKSIKRFKYQE